MKKIGIGISVMVVAAIIVLLLAEPVGMKVTKRHSPSETVEASTGELGISVTYCRPYKKERVIFGELVPYDKVWRTGANEATVFSTNKDVRFGDQELSAGDYALFTIPKEDGWTIILNNTVEQWGAFDYDQTADAIRIEVPVGTVENSVEQFTIAASEENDAIILAFTWDTTKVSVPITTQK